MASSGVPSNVYLKKLVLHNAHDPNDVGYVEPDIRLKYFKIGTGNYDAYNNPNPPSSLLTDTIGVAYPTWVMGDEWAHIGDFTDANVVDNGDGSFTAVCFLDVGDANEFGGSGSGLGNPTFYELGLFDSDDNMVAYITFDGEVKAAGHTIQHTVRFSYYT